ncbi:MAG: hypothetical protein ABUK01_13660 [Leptospirales bacterium]
MIRSGNLIHVISFFFCLNILFSFPGYSQTDVNSPENVKKKDNKTTSTTNTTKTKQTSGSTEGKIWTFQTKPEKNSKYPKGQGIEIVRAQEGEYLYIEKGNHGILVFRGGIILRYGDMDMYADEVKYNPKTGEFFGEGNIVIRDNDQTIYGDQFVFDNNKKIGVILNPSLSYNNINFKAESITIVPDEMYVLAKTIFTGCEVINPHYFFRASKVWISTENDVIALGVLYYVGLTPVFYLPFLLQTDIGTGIRTLYGNSNANGHYLQNTYSFGISRKKTSIFPEHASILADIYQYNGWYFGAYFNRKSPDLKYDISLGVARYMYRDVLTGTKRVTNYILLKNGSIGTKDDYWYEFDMNLNSTLFRNTKKDTSSQLMLVFEQYNNASFGKNFKQRHIPSNSFDSFWINRTLPNTEKLYRDTIWQAHFTQTWAEASLNVKLQRQNRWSKGANSNAEYSYLVKNDILPEVIFRTNTSIIQPKGEIFSGARNEFVGEVRRENEYKFGSSYKTINYYSALDGVRFYLPFVTVIRAAGLGAKGQKTEFAANSAASTSEDGRNSYLFGFSQNLIRIGLPEAYLFGQHEIQYAFFRDDPDPTFGNQLYHAVLVGGVVDMAPFFNMRIVSGRDLREYPNAVAELDRWLPVTAMARFDYDFVNKTPSMGYPFTRRKPYFGISIENRFDYQIRFEKPGMNTLSLYFNVGGYKFLFLREIFFMQTGISWLHDFNNNLRNQLVYELNTEIEVAKYWLIFADLRSRFVNDTPEDPYSNFGTSVTNNLSGVVSPFSVDKISAGIEHNLHRWVLRLSYTISRVWIPDGVDTKQWKGFYEKGVFLTMNLTDYPALGLPETTLYEYNPRLDQDFN